MGNNTSQSLEDPRHRLSHDFTPELDLEVYSNIVQTGNVEKASRMRHYLLIKYADYEDLIPKIQKLPRRPYSVPDLPSLDPMSGEFSFQRGLERWTSD